MSVSKLGLIVVCLSGNIFSPAAASEGLQAACDSQTDPHLMVNGSCIVWLLSTVGTTVLDKSRSHSVAVDMCKNTLSASLPTGRLPIMTPEHYVAIRDYFRGLSTDFVRVHWIGLRQHLGQASTTAGWFAISSADNRTWDTLNGLQLIGTSGRFGNGKSTCGYSPNPDCEETNKKQCAAGKGTANYDAYCETGIVFVVCEYRQECSNNPCLSTELCVVIDHPDLYYCHQDPVCPELSVTKAESIVYGNGPLSTHSNVTRFYDTNTTAAVTCQTPNYKLANGTTGNVTCLQNGNWSHNPTCVFG